MRGQVITREREISETQISQHFCIYIREFASYDKMSLNQTLKVVASATIGWLVSWLLEFGQGPSFLRSHSIVSTQHETQLAELAKLDHSCWVIRGSDYKLDFVPDRLTSC